MYRPLTKCSLYVLPFLTIKTGPDVAAQARVMQMVRRICGPVAPKSIIISNGCYVMPTLQPLEDWTWDLAADHLKSVWRANELHAMPRQERFHRAYLESFLYEIESPLYRYIPRHALAMYEASFEMTHGDATMENLMQDTIGSLRFIDWQPFRRPFIPAHRDADYGKIMQTLMGWNEQRKVDEKSIRALLAASPLAWFWCGLTFERIRKRADNSRLRVWCRERVFECIDARHWGEEA